MCDRGRVHMHASALGSQKRAQGALKLELQAFVSCMMLVLGVKMGGDDEDRYMSSPGAIL